MRKVSYGGAVSLDGFIAGPGESIDWIRGSKETAELIREGFSGVDTMLMGRKTFEFAQRRGGGPPMKGVATYVFSRTMERMPDGADGELVREDVADFVRRLKGEEGGDILVMGGGEIGSALVEAGLVDEIGFTIQPVLLGGGTPAFTALKRRIDLELIETRQLGEASVLVRYRVVNP